jgi:uncharacterized protein YndB with AHSA1/START domain
MKNTLLFDFTVDKATKTVFVTREFAADISLVWYAFTKQEILDQWWAPKPWTSKTKYMDFKVGGRRFYAMVSPEGQERWSLQEYTSISPKSNFKMSSAFAGGGVNNYPRPKLSTKSGEPHWMFDLAMCSAMPLVDHSYVDIKHLQALKELLKHAAEEATADVIETQHLSSSRKGDADEEKKKSPPLSTQSVSVTDNHPTVGVSAPRSETASMASACATVARGSQRSPRRSSEGGDDE